MFVEDGLYIWLDVFGMIGIVSFFFYLGCICMYEFGYYFNLQYFWGFNVNNFNCDQDDGIVDILFQADIY